MLAVFFVVDIAADKSKIIILYYVIMRRSLFFFALSFLCLSVICSCSKEDVQLPDPQQGEVSGDLPMGDAYILDSTYLTANHLKVYNFVYPSVDPYGEPIMLSGSITMGDDVSRNNPANGLLLYNHFTIYRADQCPSRGELSMQSMATGMGLITISADYYGFGVTEHHHQAYCFAHYNAQTCIDALLSAKRLLSQMGYRWDDLLFNVGYSQGGQTAMGVVCLAAERYPDIDITYSFAGAGSYDLPETYRQFVDATIAGMPSTVISVMLAYNEFKQIGLSFGDMFLEPVLSHIDEWILSKRYTRPEIDAMVGSLAIGDYIAPALLDTTSISARSLMSALDSDNLCKGWTPKGNEQIMLFHSTRDITVPVANTQRMYDFLLSKGLHDVDLQIHDIEGTATSPAHENAALTFGILILQKIKSILGIAV